jgi:hypothetical protein
VAVRLQALWKASTDALQAWTAALKVVLPGGLLVWMVVLQAARCGSV